MTHQTKILIIDDDEVFASTLQRSLMRRGYAVDTAVSEEAARQYYSQQPDQAVIDLKLASASGLNVLKSLLDASPKTKAIMLTGYSSIPTAVEAIKLGAINYLCKPANTDDILKAFELGTPEAPCEISNTPLSVDRLEWEHIQRVLNDHDGNISATARALNMHRRTLQRKLQKRPVQQ